MSEFDGTRVFRWTRLRSFVHGKYRAVQLSIERRGFEHKLETIIRAALAHHSGGLAAGNREYKLLKQQADSICGAFSERWKIDVSLLEAQIPAIRKLNALAEISPKSKPAILVSLGFAGAAALFFLLGILAGLTNLAYRLIGGR